ncbi:cadherin-like beta sandwich domain-containing protein [Neoaquamicrobium sediminum]|uniref:cadherin-like beta sandwich domain-containing protein n=1 Tax=Neoaquamicrobium sediminum TaxID=1849104 RepID=UPI003BA8C176
MTLLSTMRSTTSPSPPTAAGSNASITVDGQSVVSGSASQSVALAVGSTVIPVVVTAEDGVTTQAYTVTVTRAASADATLASLTPSAGTLDPAFSPSTAAYAVAVDNSTDSIALTPTAAEPNVTITVNGQNVVSGSASQAIVLAVGSTVIEVVVTAGGYNDDAHLHRHGHPCGIVQCKACQPDAERRRTRSGLQPRQLRLRCGGRQRRREHRADANRRRR